MLGFLPVFLATRDEQTRQLDMCWHVARKHPQHFPQNGSFGVPPALHLMPLHPKHPAIGIDRFQRQGPFDHDAESIHIGLAQFVTFQHFRAQVAQCPDKRVAIPGLRDVVIVPLQDLEQAPHKLFGLLLRPTPNVDQQRSPHLLRHRFLRRRNVLVPRRLLLPQFTCEVLDERRGELALEPR